MRRFALALVVLTAVAVALPERVATLDDGHKDGGVFLGEEAGAMTYMKLGAKAGAKKMWGKMMGSTLPPGTVVRKTITGVEKHGTCRFQCFKDHMCGGYAFVMASHECQLLSAPSFLAGKPGNDNWHMLAAQTTGATYKADEASAENNAMKNQIDKEPRVKSNKVPKKTDPLAGHLPMNLQGVMNNALSGLEEKTKETGLSADMTKEYNRYRSLLFQEYYQKSAHEYEIRAEAKADREADVIVKHRVYKENKKTPNNKVNKSQKDDFYAQARKEVDNHAVRKYQRKFSEDLAAYVTKKLYTEQERLKGISNLRKKAQEETHLVNEQITNKATTEGKEKPKLLDLPKGPWDAYMSSASSVGSASSATDAADTAGSASTEGGAPAGTGAAAGEGDAPAQL